jgi:lipoate-protein ligase A
MTSETSNTRAINGQYERVLNNLPESVKTVSQMMIKFEEDVVEALNDKYYSSEDIITRQDVSRILIELLQSVHSVSATRERSSWNQFTHDRLQDLKVNSETKGDHI